MCIRSHCRTVIKLNRQPTLLHHHQYLQQPSSHNISLKNSMKMQFHSHAQRIIIIVSTTTSYKFCSNATSPTQRRIERLSSEIFGRASVRMAHRCISRWMSLCRRASSPIRSAVQRGPMRCRPNWSCSSSFFSFLSPRSSLLSFSS